MSDKFYDENATSNKTWKGISKLIAIVMILAVTLLGDIMYIQLVNKVFPSGVLQIFCYVGACASFAGMGYLLVGKLVVFRPGAQMAAAWTLFGLELAIATLNVMLVFEGTSNATGFMAMWLQISPATPWLIMAMVALVFFLDPELKTKHAEMDLQAQIDEMERGFKKMQYITELKVRKEALKLSEGMLLEELHNGYNVEQLRAGVSQTYANILGNIMGHAIAPRMRARIVDSEPQEKVSLAQTAEVESPKKSDDDPNEKEGGKKSKN